MKFYIKTEKEFHLLWFACFFLKLCLKLSFIMLMTLNRFLIVFKLQFAIVCLVSGSCTVT